MALTKVINDLADLNQSGSTNALKGCRGTTAQQPASSSTIEYLMVGGGGAGGWGGGGGGAGGLLTGTTTVYHGTPTVITVGEGGNGILTTVPTYLGNGNDSGFNGIRAIGGGTGGSYYAGTGWQDDGKDGGSGGGGASTGVSTTGGQGTTDQGLGGGAGFYTSTGFGGGGGGGAGTTVNNADGTGGNGTANPAGTGGSGRDMQSFISNTNANLAQIGDVSGSNVWFAGGGGGGIQDDGVFTPVTAGTGGIGGGGDGSNSNATGSSGTNNTGGGGGAGGNKKITGVWYGGDGGDGGSGVSVIKYNNTEVTGYTLNSEDTYTVNWPADKYGAGYWPLNLDVKDVGGHYDGTAIDVTYVTGKFNQAASFNGSSSHIDIPAGLGTSGNRTRAVWIYINGMPPSSQGETIYYLGANGSNAYYESLLVRETAGASTYNIRWHDRYNTLDNDILDSTTTVTTGVWYHVAIVRDGTTQKMYINGSLDNSRTNSYSIVDNTAYALTIGEWNGSSPCCYYEGVIEQVRFYTSALSDSDILDIYNNSKPGSLPPLSSTAPTIDSLSFPSGVTTKALWDFNGDLIADPTTYNGSITSAISYATGKFTDQALYFSGAGGGLISTNYTRSGSNFTASLWVNLLDRGDRQVFLGDGNNTGSDISISITIQITWPGDVLKVFMNSADGASTGTSVTTNVDWNNYWGKWTHVAVTQNVGDVKVYVNGILVDTLTVTGSDILYGSAAHPISLGSWGVAATNNGETYGSINLMRFYDVTLTDQNIYDLWQKETNIQTHFTSGSTDTLVFKEGSGEITFTGDPEPGADIGMLRYNSTLGQMEHFNAGGWKDFTDCTTSICNYPTTIAAFYQFNNSPNSTCAGPNPTTTANLTYTNGPYGGAINFNGTDSVWQSTSQIINSQSSFTISMWMRMDAYNGNSQYLWTSYATGDWGISFSQKSPYDRYVSFHKWNSTYGGGLAIDAPDITELGQWYHICGTFSTTTGMVLYINGVSVATSSTTWTGYNHGAYSDSIGCYGGTWTGPRANFTGQISLFRAFQSTLTATQVTELYNEVHCP